MAFGLSNALRYLTFAKPEPRETRGRDRSLRGKARVRARKIAQRAART